MTISTITDIESVLSKTNILDLTLLRKYESNKVIEDSTFSFKKSSNNFITTLQCVAHSKKQFSTEVDLIKMPVFFKFEIVDEHKEKPLKSPRPRGWLYVSMSKKGKWVRVHVDFHVYDKPIEDFIRQLSIDIEHVLIKPHLYFPEKFCRGSRLFLVK